MIKVYDGNHANKIESFHDMAKEVSGIIHKATEGLYFIDDASKSRRDRALSVGLPWANYHFASNEDSTAQCDFFLEHTTINHNEPNVLDYEYNKRGTMTFQQAEKWVSRVYGKTGRWPWWYLNESTLLSDWAKYGSHSSPLVNCKLWIAKYSPGEPTVPKDFPEFLLWQYGEKENCQGVSDLGDMSYFKGTVDQLKEIWNRG